MDKSYQLLLAEIKATIQVERTKAARQLTRSLIGVYWGIGRNKTLARLANVLFLTILFVGFANNRSCAQANIIELSDKADPLYGENRRIRITNQSAWFFRAGNNPQFASVEMDTTEWIKMTPRQMTKAFANASGEIEGWFRAKIKADSSLGNIPFYIDVVSKFSASEIYLDGQPIHAIGNIGAAKTDFRRENTLLNPNMVHANFAIGTVHDLAIHFKIILPKFPWSVFAQDDDLHVLVAIAGTESREYFSNKNKWTILILALACAAFAITWVLFWLLSFYNPGELAYKSIAVFNFILSAIMAYGLKDHFADLSFTSDTVLSILNNLLPALAMYFLFLAGFQISTGDNPKRIKSIRLFYVALTIPFLIINTLPPAFNFDFLLFVLFSFTLAGVAYNIYKYRNKGRKSNRAIAAGILLTLFFILFELYLENLAPSFINSMLEIGDTSYAILIFSYIFPVSLLFYVSLRIKEILDEVRLNADKVVQIAEEKRALLASQNTMLENQVRERTAELRGSLQNLQATQSQLIQSEKLASLGELTAGIAHEIQNPLNFVNNFSELSVDLIKEIKDERQKPVEKRDEALEDELLNDLSQNQEKINHHGKRAAGIVSGMLQHARMSTGKKEPTDLNALADEYLRLSYHGLRAKNSTFNASMVTDFDPAVGMVEVIPQDMGRVFLNIINNAFYATQQRKAENAGAYEPTVSISSKKTGSAVEFRIKDNGTGIPDDVKARIFQPFFTTKPTGQGTGLGLSLAYDIVVKGHGGSLDVETMEGEGTEFLIKLNIVSLSRPKITLQVKR